jgi:hypothetical protein
MLSLAFTGASGDIDENKGERRNLRGCGVAPASIIKTVGTENRGHSRRGGNPQWAPAFAGVTICGRYSAIGNRTRKYSGASGDIDENKRERSVEVILGSRITSTKEAR